MSASPVSNQSSQTPASQGTREASSPLDLSTSPVLAQPRRRKAPPPSLFGATAAAAAASPVERVQQVAESVGLFSFVEGTLTPTTLRGVHAAFTGERRLSANPFGGANGSLTVLGDDGTPIAVFKPQENERGTPFHQAAARSQRTPHAAAHSKDGIEPGESASTEYIAYKYLQATLASFPSLQITLAPTSYGRGAATALHTSLPGEEAPSAVLKTGSFHKFIDRAEQYNPSAHPVNPETIQALAMLNMLLMDADRHAGNFLFAEGKVVLIDQGLCWPRLGQSNLVLAHVMAWAEQLKMRGEFPQRFIEEVARGKEPLKEPLSAAIADIAQVGGGAAGPIFSPERYWTHEVSAHILQVALEQGLSLFEILPLFMSDQVNVPDNVITRLAIHLGYQGPAGKITEPRPLTCPEKEIIQAMITSFKAELDETPMEARDAMKPAALWAFCMQAKQKIRLETKE